MDLSSCFDDGSSWNVAGSRRPSYVRKSSTSTAAVVIERTPTGSTKSKTVNWQSLKRTRASSYCGSDLKGKQAALPDLLAINGINHMVNTCYRDLSEPKKDVNKKPEKLGQPRPKKKDLYSSFSSQDFYKKNEAEPQGTPSILLNNQPISKVDPLTADIDRELNAIINISKAKVTKDPLVVSKSAHPDLSSKGSTEDDGKGLRGHHYYRRCTAKIRTKDDARNVGKREHITTFITTIMRAPMRST